MQPPAFWSRPPDSSGALPRLLAPAALIWRVATARRVARPPTYRAPVPVICVGNLTLGGAGKTPTVSWLLSELSRRGVAAAALSRGHGGTEAGPHLVDERKDDAARVGDEPLLLSGFGPVWVARDRAEGARAMAAAGVGAIVMDDGFQNPSLAKDLSIVVVDAEAGFGNGRVCPAGPLREPVAAGLGRADLLLSIGPQASQASLLRRWPILADGPPLVRATLEPLPTGMPWSGLRCLAFAGIGRPGKFFATLRGLGAEVVAERVFPDHAAYPRAMAERLIAEAARLGAQPVTTEKDLVRFPKDLRPQVLTLPVRLHPEDPARLAGALNALFAD